LYIYSGYTCFNADRTRLLVDNLAKGFDLYDFPQSSPSDSFAIPRERAFVQEAIFLEDETMIACGSDHGRIYTFSVGTAKCIQKIKHGSSKSLVQILSVRTLPSLALPFTFHLIINYQSSTTRERHLIASGTNDKTPNIYVWEKQVGFKYTYISESLLNEFQREKDIVFSGGDEEGGAT
jgi:hypothetical protein